MSSLKKYVYLLSILSVCVFLFVACDANKNTEGSGVDYSKYSFVNVLWTRESEHDTETIYFAGDGSFRYSCACGNPVNDSDLCEGYIYDDFTKTIILDCIEITDEMVTVIKIVKCDENSLHLDFDGEIRIFEK